MFFNAAIDQSQIFSVTLPFSHAFVIVISFFFNILFLFFQGPLLLFLHNLALDIWNITLCLDVIR